MFPIQYIIPFKAHLDINQKPKNLKQTTEWTKKENYIIFEMFVGCLIKNPLV